MFDARVFRCRAVRYAAYPVDEPESGRDKRHHDAGDVCSQPHFEPERVIGNAVDNERYKGLYIKGYWKVYQHRMHGMSEYFYFAVHRFILPGQIVVVSLIMALPYQRQPLFIKVMISEGL